MIKFQVPFLSISGTSHRRGVTIEDIEELKKTGAKTVVLSMGKMSLLHVPHQVLDELTRLGYNVIVKSTSIAMATYNLLVEKGHPVAALFHTTC